MTRSRARLAAVLLLFGLVSAGTAPCLCAAAAPAAAADHCGAPAAGLRAADHACACPCMTSAGDAADRPEVEPRVVPAPLAALAPPRLPHVVRVAPAPRASGPPQRAAPSPPTVLRI